MSDLKDIAAGLLSTTPADATETAAPAEAETLLEGAQSPTDGEEVEADDDQPEEADAELSEHDDEEGSDDDADKDDVDEDGPQVVQLDDDDLIEVMVDGELQEMPLRDLKRAASGEGAIEKRLREATETRKDADTYRTTSRDMISRQTAVLTAVVQNLDQMLFSGQPPQVDETLKHTQPQRYVMQVTEASQFRERMNEGRQQLASLVQKISDEIEASTKAFRDKEQQTLRKKLPILSDPQRGRERVNLVMDKALNYYGFTEPELALIADSRVLHALHDAAMYRAAQKGEVKAAAEKTPVRKSSKAHRVVPSTSRSAEKARAAARQKQQRAKAHETALRKGDVQSIAAGLLQPKSTATKG